ncbi:hypothetical protein ACFQX8_01365 [Klenkia terrae]|uniref:hypothetical protein n=1 Tax=Klenkia terrae TaxID=1052259 RepID=UPI0036214968
MATTSAGTPDAEDQIWATPGPATSRTWLPSSPAGGAWPPACAARSLENVNTAEAWPPTCTLGSPTTPPGSSATSGTSRAVSAAAAAGSATVCRSPSPVTSTVP